LIVATKERLGGSKNIAMTSNTITKTKNNDRDVLLINSLPMDVTVAAQAIRGHWMVESFTGN
jgi:hypothetical protein